MWTETPVFREDLERLAACSFIPWGELKGKTVLITGATGLIGYTLASSLLYYSKVHGVGIQVFALVRDLARAREKFRGQLADQCSLTFVQGSVENLPEIPGNIDYIVHGASPTASTFFVERPVETIMTTVLGTHNVLELARKKQVSGFVYLSSMEVYGAPKTDDPIDEKFPTGVDAMSVRSSYPQAKLLCETLCASYWGEYAVPAKTVRLAQTFGPGIAAEDNRVFAQFARAAKEGNDIILKTTGESKRTYLYTADAASAILTVLLRGETGQAYNAANPDTYCSILEMAHMVAKKLANGKIAVKMQIDKNKIFQFPPPHCFHLQVRKLKGLGWATKVDLLEMYRRMLGKFCL